MSDQVCELHGVALEVNEQWSVCPKCYEDDNIMEGLLAEAIADYETRKDGSTP